MLDRLFGNRTASRALLYLQRYGEGYASGIAATFGLGLRSVQLQLEKLEAEGIIASRMKGRTRVFSWNPSWPLLEELRGLLERAFDYMDPVEIEKHYMQRTRPRRRGKPVVDQK